MTFYEELGVPPDASPDTIREAFRNVAKVLHPDAQTNPILKESAEVQMKRVNHLYEVLSNPEQRRRYDQELADPPERPATLIIHAPPPAGRYARGHSGTLTWLAATAICGSFIIWLATRESASPTVYPQPAPATGEASGPLSSTPSALRKAAVALLPSFAAADRVRDAEIVRLRTELAAAYKERDRLGKQIAAMQADRRFQLPPAAAGGTQPGGPQPAALNPAPLAAMTPPVDLGIPVLRPVSPPPAAAPKSRWAGSWAYNQRGENRNKTLHPPEFIETVMTEDGGNLRGQYHARFKVEDKKISPEVDFRFEGRIAGTSGRFTWSGTGGAKGEVQIRMVSDSMLEVVWTATDLGRTMGLASGTAILSRKN
jgi:curved DNA-binding protein CbpA